jgi:hypothetical protein
MKKTTALILLLHCLTGCGDSNPRTTVSPDPDTLKERLITEAPFVLEEVEVINPLCDLSFTDELPQTLVFSYPSDNIQPTAPTVTNFNDLFDDQYLVDVEKFTALLIREDISTLDHTMLFYSYSDSQGFVLEETVGVKIDVHGFTLEFKELGEICFTARYK